MRKGGRTHLSPTGPGPDAAEMGAMCREARGIAEGADEQEAGEEAPDVRPEGRAAGALIDGARDDLEEEPASEHEEGGDVITLHQFGTPSRMAIGTRLRSGSGAGN